MQGNMEREKYVRVTDILQPYTGLGGIDPQILKAAGERGTKVHHAIFGKLNGFAPDIDDSIKGYLDSFNKWTQPEYIAMENRYYNDDLMLTGQVDAIIEIDGQIGILDYKTSSKPSPTWALQLSAYAYLAFGKKAPLYVLHLKKDGSEPDFLTYDYDFDTFLKCYELYKHFNKEKFNESSKTRRRSSQNASREKSDLDACL